MISSSKYIFLSRPRRFGKSLLLSTIRYIYEGKKELFKGLYIEEKWDWNENYPVVRIDFAKDIRSKEELYEVGYSQLMLNYRKLNIEMNVKIENIGLLLEGLIIGVSERYKKQVVVLIDEYDKPILDVIEKKRKRKR